ncbi:MAG TPA: phosphotransferase [Solirubrobacteraceae bacterium]|nr:phosphotransferase [Solirubrobacteraceae bacterium]
MSLDTTLAPIAQIESMFAAESATSTVADKTVDYIVVQAGGKGTRLEHLTTNKPKALVPVENLPMVFHLFRKFPDKRFIVIADYQREVLREYLAAFAEVEYQVVDAPGEGTCSGVAQALDLLPDDEPFMLVWSDLILPADFELPAGDRDWVGISETFECRWTYTDGRFVEDRSREHGVAGLFVFQDKSSLSGIPASGELVRWLAQNGPAFDELGLAGTREFGLLSEYQALALEKTRPFNRATVLGERFIKEPVDQQGRSLARREVGWYRHAVKLGVNTIPHLYEFEPLTIERIDGKNIYEYAHLPLDSKRRILADLTAALRELHSLESAPADSFSTREAYYGKTIERLTAVRDLIPFADAKTITVNGRECRNVYFYKRDLERVLDALNVERFAFIHGDPTFSNLMLRGGTEPVLIDPRGYFGYTELHGDPNYDWAKLYYSVVGNYDQFNLKNFRLSLNPQTVDLTVDSNGWESLEDDLFALSGADPRTIKLLHAVIWLSLTTYAWHDYDSICGAFYNGIYYLEEAL